MKKTLFMLTFLSMLACQKKQYATFQKSNIAIFDKKKTLTLANLSTIKRQDSTVLGEIYKTAYPTKLTFTAVHFNSRREVASTHKAKATTKDAIFADGLKVEKQKKQLRKKPSDPDRLAKTALILGIASIVGVALLGSFGALIGLIAIVFGAISYKKTTKRAWAIWGIVLGSVSILAIIIAIIALVILLTAIIGA